ncbi:MAG: DNA-binding domain-containing protein [archaeon]|nr:DNA-binding domain-containing protein [archaeon]
MQDPLMEKKLIQWYTIHHIQNGLEVNSRLIQSMAQHYSSNRNFRASKGWLEKFKKRHKLYGK